MTTAPDTATPDARGLSRNLDDACRDVDATIARTDSKASLLLAFDGAVLAGVASLADRHLPPAATVFGALAVAALAAAAVLLLLVVRPNLGGNGRIVREGFPRWAQLSEDALLTALRTDTRATRVKALSVLAVRKYQRLTRAVDTILAALALLLAAAASALT
ncbi:Pycsar system effector family protein [Streptomyces chartreusis]|uniref:Pycsar system effector family protein n=1 Tax=Streptomyces chartreusis TaxID=1969 RepID=UPI0034004E41